MGRHAGSLRKARRSLRSEVVEIHIDGIRTVLALPLTFMNESGQAVAPLVRYYGVDLDDLLVVHDDIDLPFAKLRLQFDRGSGGNNGARSIIRSVGSAAFWRLKCGVGRPPDRIDPAEYVLHRFTRSEQPAIDDAKIRAMGVVERFIVDGGEAAQQFTGDRAE